MHAATRNLGERDELVLAGEPKLEPFGAQPEPEERRDVYLRTDT